MRLANKCARERMTVLYDQSAWFEGLVLGTSNKSELLLGYGTQFGDMASAINPIGDLYKTQLYPLAAYLGVPEAILSKTPTGDLWIGQTDEGELGFTYADVDRLLFLLVDRRWQVRELWPPVRRRVRRTRDGTGPPQPLQTPPAGHRQVVQPHHGPRFPLPAIGEPSARWFLQSSRVTFRR